MSTLRYGDYEVLCESEYVALFAAAAEANLSVPAFIARCILEACPAAPSESSASRPGALPKAQQDYLDALKRSDNRMLVGAATAAEATLMAESSASPDPRAWVGAPLSSGTFSASPEPRCDKPGPHGAHSGCEGVPWPEQYPVYVGQPFVSGLRTAPPPSASPGAAPTDALIEQIAQAIRKYAVAADATADENIDGPSWMYGIDAAIAIVRSFASTPTAPTERDDA